ncbi:TPA: hypothetical protein PXP51_001873 [Yersinia enterocolitica]|nr:hypothetical protein [Yersinia enterocolitica]
MGIYDSSNQKGGMISRSSCGSNNGEITPVGATPLGRYYYLFRSMGRQSNRLLITAHGEQSLLPKWMLLPKESIIRYYSSDNHALYDPDLEDVAARRVIPRESVSGGGYIRNYNISKYAKDTYESTRYIAERYGVDVLTVRNRKEREIYLSDLSSLFKVMKSNNISYKYIDALYCRSAWLSRNGMPQSAYRI